MKKKIIRNVMMFLFSAMIIISVTSAQEKPEKMKHPKECKCEKCVDSSKMMKDKESCKCCNCTAAKDAKMTKDKKCCKCSKCIDAKKAKMMKCKEGCECSKCTTSKKMKMKKHSADCSCEKCKAASKTTASAIWNSHCPIGEEPVDPKTATVKYKGKVIGFCCPGCEKKFMKDPAKYIKKFDSNGNLLKKS